MDAVIDTVGGDTLDRSWGVLRPGGVLVTIAGDAPEAIAAKYGVRGVSMLVQPNRAQLVEIAGLIDASRVRVVVDAVFPLPRARDAFERGLLGRKRPRTLEEAKRVLDLPDEVLSCRRTCVEPRENTNESSRRERDPTHSIPLRRPTARL